METEFVHDLRAKKEMELDFLLESVQEAFARSKGDSDTDAAVIKAYEDFQKNIQSASKVMRKDKNYVVTDEAMSLLRGQAQRIMDLMAAAEQISKHDDNRPHLAA